MKKKSQYETPECMIMQVSPEGVMCQSSFINGASNNEFIGDESFGDDIWL
ncbi:MAG: hypothetical protein ACI3ZS_09760 [Candidatus Cryptobacteroides sp.]